MGGWEEGEEGEGRGRVDSAPMRSLFMSFTPQDVVAWLSSSVFVRMIKLLTLSIKLLVIAGN